MIQKLKFSFTPWMNLCLEREFLVLPEQIVALWQRPGYLLAELFHAKIGCHQSQGRWQL